MMFRFGWFLVGCFGCWLVVLVYSFWVWVGVLFYGCVVVCLIVVGILYLFSYYEGC